MPVRTALAGSLLVVTLGGLNEFMTRRFVEVPCWININLCGTQARCVGIGNLSSDFTLESSSDRSWQYLRKCLSSRERNEDCQRCGNNS